MLRWSFFFFNMSHILNLCPLPQAGRSTNWLSSVIFQSLLLPVQHMVMSVWQLTFSYFFRFSILKITNLNWNSISLIVLYNKTIRMIIRMIMKWTLAPLEATTNSTTFTWTKARLRCFNIVARPAFLSHWFVANISWTSFLAQKICKMCKMCTTKNLQVVSGFPPAFAFVASIANFWSCLLCGRILTILKSLVGQNRKKNYDRSFRLWFPFVQQATQQWTIL